MFQNSETTIHFLQLVDCFLHTIVAVIDINFQSEILQRESIEKYFKKHELNKTIMNIIQSFNSF